MCRERSDGPSIGGEDSPADVDNEQKAPDGERRLALIGR